MTNLLHTDTVYAFVNIRNCYQLIMIIFVIAKWFFRRNFCFSSNIWQTIILLIQKYLASLLHKFWATSLCFHYFVSAMCVLSALILYSEYNPTKTIDTLIMGDSYLCGLFGFGCLYLCALFCFISRLDR